MNQPYYAVLARLSAGCPPLEGRLPTCYSPVRHFNNPRRGVLVRLACVKHAASVRSEPGSNSPLGKTMEQTRDRSRKARLSCCSTKLKGFFFMGPWIRSKKACEMHAKHTHRLRTFLHKQTMHLPQFSKNTVLCLKILKGHQPSSLMPVRSNRLGAYGNRWALACLVFQCISPDLLPPLLFDGQTRNTTSTVR